MERSYNDRTIDKNGVGQVLCHGDTVRVVELHKTASKESSRLLAKMSLSENFRLFLDDPSSNAADAYSSFMLKFVFEKNINKHNGIS